jgi:thiol-disulfide isomerase/thioredoxin
MRHLGQALRLGLVAAVAMVAVAGCSDLQGTDGKQYVGGDGQIIVIPPEDRTDPVAASGPAIDGGELDLADYRGDVVVANLWWSGCGPCRKEMPILDDVGDGTALLGINTREPSKDNALSFMRGLGLDFPSFYDPGGEVLLAFDKIRPQAIPSTAILDRQGRLAALVSGEVTSPVTLRDVIADVVAEDG